MFAITDYRFEYRIDGIGTFEASFDEFPLSDMEEVDDVSSLMVDDWNEDTQRLMWAGVAPAIAIAIAAGETMAERLGVRATTEDRSKVNFTLYDPTGKPLYVSPTVELGCVVADDSGHPYVSLDPKDFTLGVGAHAQDVLKNKDLPQDIKEKIDAQFPQAPELNERLVSLSREDMMNLTVIVMGTIKAITTVLAGHIHR